MKKLNLASGFVALVMALSLTACASHETPAEKAETASNRAADQTREKYRNSKDEICELVNGKMDCVAQKIENKSKSAWDKTKTKAKEIKNKVDE